MSKENQEPLYGNIKHIKAYFGKKVIGVLENLLYSIFRTDQGQDRIHTGSLQWKQFDVEPLIEEHGDRPWIWGWNIDDLRPESNEEPPWYPDQLPAFDICTTLNNGSELWLYGVELLNRGCKGVSLDDIVTEHNYNFTAKMFERRNVPRQIAPWKKGDKFRSTTELTTHYGVTIPQDLELAVCFVAGGEELGGGVKVGVTTIFKDSDGNEYAVGGEKVVQAWLDEKGLVSSIGIPRGYVPNHKFWDQMGHSGCTGFEGSGKESEDRHAGMIYNPITDKWSWL